MKKLAVWFVVTVAVVIAVLLLVFVAPASPAAQRLVRPGPLSSAHAYLATRCMACHEAGVGVTVAKCTACHASSKPLLGRQPTAFHASIEACATCHVEHRGTSPRPVTMDHVALAQIGARTLSRAARTDPESAATSSSLGTWLQTSDPDDMDATAAREVLDCAGCHDRKDRHLGRFGRDCGQCHRLTSWSVPGYRHPSPRSSDCVQCHQPPPSHRMGHFSMVSQQVAGKEASVDECYQCHNTTSWNDIVDVGYYKHH